ncbi:MAG TPA: DinB family protein [Blastocatellia bacterium]|nr:DinB family protein [Blastocatellia bacterium]
MHRPEPAEYVQYYGKYVSLVPGDNIVNLLGQQIEETMAFLRSLDEAQGDLRYAPGKWNVKEVIGHMIDVERIFAYRALRIARDDRTPLAGFEENDYIANSNFKAYPVADITDEFETVRRATLYLFKRLDPEAWLRRGIANENEISVRALAYIIAGHELHHREIIRSRYL